MERVCWPVRFFPNHISLYNRFDTDEESGKDRSKEMGTDGRGWWHVRYTQGSWTWTECECVFCGGARKNIYTRAENAFIWDTREIFMGRGGRFAGVEIEIDTVGNCWIIYTSAVGVESEERKKRRNSLNAIFFLFRLFRPREMTIFEKTFEMVVWWKIRRRKDAWVFFFFFFLIISFWFEKIFETRFNDFKKEKRNLC